MTILGVNIGDSRGLFWCFTWLLGQQQRFRKQVVILCDVKPFYGALKGMYSLTHAAQNMRTAMEHTPLILGLWHCYAHCVWKTFEAFRTLWVTRSTL